MENKNFFANDFQLQENEPYHLSMQVCSEGFLYSILDIKNRKYCGLKQYATTGTNEDKSEQIINILAQEAHFSFPFTSVYLQTQSYKAMLVPESLFDSNNLRTFLKFHHDVDEKDRIHFAPVKAAEAFIIFSIPVAIEDEILKYFPNVKFSHHSIPFITTALQSSTTNDTLSTININFGKDFFDVLIVRNKKILLFNSFFYQKYTDVVYFVSNIINLFSLQPSHSQIIISGLVEEKSEIEAELAKMFSAIYYAQYNLDFKYAEALSSIPQHYYVNHLNLYHCEL